MARDMKMHWELTKSRKHNEKHGFDEIPKFQKMLIFEIFWKMEKSKNMKNKKWAGDKYLRENTGAIYESSERKLG